MTICEVRNEAGAAAGDLAAVLAILADQVVPVVEHVTGLSLGAWPVIRVLPPEVWVMEVAEDGRRWGERDIADLGLGAHEAAVRRAQGKAHEEELLLVWPTVMGAVVEAGDGTPQFLLVPEVVRHHGFQAPELMKMIAHGLTGVAQHCASHGTAFLAQQTKYPHLRGLPEGAVAGHFIKGHSRWCGLEVMTRLVGHDVHGDTGRQSEDLRQLHGWLSRRRRAGMPNCRADPDGVPGRPLQARTDGAQQWVRAVVADAGTGVLNRVWQDITLMPTAAELKDPRAWVERIT